VIELRDVWKAFGDKPVLRGLDLAVERGEIMFIIGTSGVGKSVAIKHLVGLLRVDRGEIWFDGERIDDLSEKEMYAIRKRLGMVFQSATLFDSMTLCENVALPLRKHRGMREREAETEALRRLDQVHMAAFAHRYPTELSDGMRKRAAIARTLTLEPEAVLFDEPTTGLDPVSARRIDRLIRELSDDLGVTSIVVSHDLDSIFSIADRIAFLYEGRVHLCGTQESFRQSSDPVVQQFITGQSTGPMATPGF
jgi:phospholipid/cholesterol/gamma-HCH transport system ATP-binding protein